MRYIFKNTNGAPFIVSNAPAVVAPFQGAFLLLDLT